MNKLEGFYELNRIGLPSIPWKRYEGNVSLDDNILWTVRSAVLTGNDLNLPRKVGVSANEATEFAEQLSKKLGEHDLILYYPYFIAEKSGVMEVASSRIVIEAVQGDLWNLVTYNKRDVTLIISGNETFYNGNKDFLEENEVTEITKNVSKIRLRFRDLIHQGKSIFLEWSYSFVSDIEKNPTGEKYLVFYEIRSVP